MEWLATWGTALGAAWLSGVKLYLSILTLGLLQHFDLSYVYPFQGASVIIITLLAAIILKEKLTFRIIAGTLLITAGAVLVSMS